MPEPQKIDALARLHINPKIDLGHMLATMALIGAMVAGYAQFSERLRALETQQSFTSERIVSLLESQRHTDVRQDAEILEVKRQVREDFRDINIKLDNLLRLSVQRSPTGGE